jgi:acylphosphatase
MSTGSSTVRLQARVEGRVQGVGFRHHTLRRARELALTGYVRNRWDGTVQVVAEGRRSQVEELLSFLRAGPRSAFVTAVDAEWSEPGGDFDRFEVRF